MESGFIFSVFVLAAARGSLANFSTVANIATSLPFLAVGLVGIRHIFPASARNVIKPSRVVFVLSLILVGAGSVFYHVFPSTEHLLWDRLPIAVCLAAFVCAIADAGRDSRIGSALLFPVLVVSISSVLYWYVTWTHGHEDLRPYAIVQLGTVLWAVIAVFWRPPYGGARALRWALGAYAVGRICELFQQQVYDKFGVDLGHPLKHLLVALATYLIVRALASPLSEQPETANLAIEAASADLT